MNCHLSYQRPILIQRCYIYGGIGNEVSTRDSFWRTEWLIKPNEGNNQQSSFFLFFLVTCKKGSIFAEKVLFFLCIHWIVEFWYPSFSLDPMDLCLDLGTGMDKVVWKTGLCLCISSLYSPIIAYICIYSTSRHTYI